MRPILSFFILLFCTCSSYISFSQELPIKPSRTISFTTDEGSYMDVDVSPDGKTLLFTLLGDIYSVPATGGTATQLTRGLALNLSPVWSPDGQKIAYLSDATGSWRLHVRDFAGTLHSVLGKSDEPLDWRTYGRDIRWTPEGHYIALGDSVYGLAGGKLAQTNIRHLAGFSADGKAAYYRDSGKIYRIDLATDTRTAMAPIKKDFRRGALSPDGRWWAYLVDSNERRSLILQDLKNNTRRILIPSLCVQDSSYITDVIPTFRFSFSSDSKSIFIGYGGKIHHLGLDNGEDKVVPFVANIHVDLGPFNYNTYRLSHDSLRVKYTRSANASPDGRHLVFSALAKIYVEDISSGKTSVLADQPFSQFQPVYSPDGKWIAYVSWNDTAGGGLWRVPATGGQPVQLAAVAGQYQRPTWSPDGNLIAIIKAKAVLGPRDDEGQGQLELVSVNGGPIRVIDDTVPVWNQVAFSDNGKRIIYEPKRRVIRDLKSRTTQAKLYRAQTISRDLDGRNEQILTVGRTSELNTFYQQRSVSPDGKFIVYSEGEDLYLVPTCTLAEPTVLYDQGQRLSVIRFAQGVDPNWEQGGAVLSWSYGNRFYRVDPQKIVMIAAKEVQQREGSGRPDEDIITSMVIPDQMITMNVTVPRFYAHGTLALKGVRIITMLGARVIEQGSIVIRDGRFLAIGPSATTPIPTGAKQVDLSGTTIIPGFVDLHSHGQMSSDIFPQQSWVYLANLAYGVTTIRNPAASLDAFGYSELIEVGQMIGPRFFSVGRAIDPAFSIRCNALDDALEIVKKRAAFGGKIIKQYNLHNRIQRQWLLMASKKIGLNMTNEGDYDPILQVAMIKDGSTGVEHNPVWGDIYKDVINFIAKANVYFTPALQACYGKEEAKQYFNYTYWHEPDAKLKRFTPAKDLEKITKAAPADSLQPGFLTPARLDARISHQGGRVTMGSHGEDKGIGVHNEIWALQMGGLTNLEALRSATILGAEGLGVQHDLGSIEVGKIADLIILNKNPLDDIHNTREIRYVMKDGILYDGDTLDEIWPTVKKCPEWRLKTNDKSKPE